MSKNKIYTRNGDKGKTCLLNLNFVLKCNEQIQLCNLIDKLITWLGYIFIHKEINIKWKIYFMNISNIFFLMSAEISYTCKNSKNIYIEEYSKLLSENLIILEKKIDYINKYTPILRNFILPMDCTISSHLHIIRNYIRDVEIGLVYLFYKQYSISSKFISYCNRLSDFFFCFC